MFVLNVITLLRGEAEDVAERPFAAWWRTHRNGVAVFVARSHFGIGIVAFFFGRVDSCVQKKSQMKTSWKRNVFSTHCGIAQSGCE